MRLSEADKAMPGAGGRERFRVASPGRLLVMETNGTVRALIDGAVPTAASMNLIDVSAPSVSYDGQWILFAGLPAPPAGQTYSRGPFYNPGRWRIFVIRSDGSGLRQITSNDPALDAINLKYDDTDPAWLPDGRIVFSSTRMLTAGEYGAAPRGTNLHVINADGTGEHRITSERNGADRPVIDPLTGRIAFARWWLNGRFPTDRTDTAIESNSGGYRWFDGLTHQGEAATAPQSGGPGAVDSNDWITTTVNPDGTDLQLFTGHVRLPQFIMANNCYGGVFAADGSFYGNFFPDLPLTEGSGFGGIRRYRRGALTSSGVWGKVVKDDDFIRKEDPVSLTVMHSANGYAADPAILSDGRLLFSWARDPATGAEDIGQDYGLFIINPSNPSTPTLVYDVRGTTELRAQVLRPRPVPPIIVDKALDRPTPTPISTNSQIFRDGEFIFDALNVYFNGPVDMQIVNAPAIGSATKMRFFADYQRNPLSSDMSLNYPVKLAEVPVPPSGKVRQTAPANVSLFEDMRRDNGSLPMTQPTGGAFVTGFNHGRPGTTARCVGCHAGHTFIPVPATDEEAQWTNLAPGATGVSPSLIDRKSATSATFSTATLTFPVPIKVRRVSLWGATSTQATVQLFSDAGATTQVAQASGSAAATGGNIALGDVVARAVRVVLTSGTSLKEIEVIASGNTGATPAPAPDATPPVISGVSGSQITTNSATINWTTDENSDSQVEYGLTNAYGSQTTLNTTMTTTHQTNLSGLTAGVIYHYRVKSKDVSNNLAVSSDFTFSTATATPTDNTAPLISSVSSSGMTASSATITWATNESSDSQVEYGPTNAYGTQTALNTLMTTSHQMNLSGLTADTLYHYRVKSKDAANNLAISSDFTFSTTPQADTTAPLISSVLSSGVTANSATIAWVTDENADSQVEYGLTSTLGTVSALNPTQTTTHQIGLSGLEPGKTYYFRVKSKDSSSNLALSEILNFATPADTTPPGTLTSFTALPGNGQISLKWTNPAESDFKGVMIRYRTDGTYPTSQNDGLLVVDKNGSPGAADTFVHTGLNNGATYYYSGFAYDLSLSFSPAAKTSATPSSLTLLSLSPTRGPLGAIVTLTGTGFGNTQGTSKVTFSGIAAAVSAWSDTSITTTVPNGAISGPTVVTVNGIPSNGVTFKVNGKLPPPKNLSQK